MKVQIVIAAFAALLLPVNGALRQCAGTGADRRYEPSGYLSALFTQGACGVAGGSIDPDRKGNQKCCNVADETKFNDSCGGQKPPTKELQQKFSAFHPVAQAC